MKKKWIYSSLCLLLIGCAGRQIGLGMPYSLDTTPPAGSAIFQQGWQHGCESGLSSIGNQFNKLFHTFRYEAEMITNKEYERAWNAGNLYCRIFTYTSDMHGQGNFANVY